MSRRRASRPGGEQRGSSTVLAVMVMVMVLAVAIVAGWWAGVVGARHRAATGADLAALAAAHAQVRGLAPCAEAVQVARRNGVDVVGCGVHEGAVRVTVAVPVRVDVMGRSWPVTVRREAWAGPVSPGTGQAAW